MSSEVATNHLHTLLESIMMLHEMDSALLFKHKGPEVFTMNKSSFSLCTAAEHSSFFPLGGDMSFQV